MKVIHNILFVCFLLTVTNCVAVTGTTQHNSNPSNINHIGLFENGKLIVIGKDNKYQIGKFNGIWSKKFPLQKTGLDFVNFTLSSDKGVFLIGGLKHKSEETLVYYRGRTVLIDNDNNLINKWDYDSTFNSAELFNGDVVGSTGNNIYRLKKDGKTDLIHKRNRKTLISIVLDENGNTIICNPRTARKVNTLTSKFGCYKGSEWDFNGRWYDSTNKYHTEPVRCGKWLIEPVQNGFNKDITGLKVRDLNTGKLINERTVSGVNRFLCINNKSIIVNTSLTSYSLPDLKPAESFSCHGNEPVKSIMNFGELTACLTEQGNIGKLEAKHKK